MTKIGSFVAIWMLGWLLLTLAFMFIWPVLRQALSRLHPANASLLALLFGSMPLVASLLTTILLFNPESQIALIQPHCHADCGSHIPLLDSVYLSALGLLAATLILGRLLLKLTDTVQQARQLRRQFELVAQPRFEQYRLLDGNTPLVFTLGWLNPQIYISKALIARCSTQELDIIIQHEQAHRQRRDNLTLLLARLSGMIAPRILTRAWLNDLHLFCEQACDATAARQHGEVAVAETLLRVKRLLLAHPAPSLAYAQSFGGSELQARVHSLLDADNRLALKLWQLACIVVATLIGTLLLVEPMHHAAEWLFERLPAW